MSTAVENTESGETGRFLNRVQGYLSGRRGLIILALTVIGAGVAFSWSWLTAIGVAPILLALAPCAAMCALGLCTNRVGGKSCSKESVDARRAGFTTNERN